jgi:hypothetical protein
MSNALTWIQPNKEAVGVGPVVAGIEPDPAITTLTPNTTSAAGGAVTVTVTGTNFVSGSTIEIDQVAVPTTFVSATSLTTSYDPSTAGTVVFTVRNPNDEESNGVNFIVGATVEE